MSNTLSRLTRFAILPLVIAVGAMTLGSADTDARFDRVGHKLMCACGCSQVLLACGHLEHVNRPERRDRRSGQRSGLVIGHPVGDTSQRLH